MNIADVCNIYIHVITGETSNENCSLWKIHLVYYK